MIEEILPFTHAHSGFLSANTTSVRLRRLGRHDPAKKSTVETVGVEGKDPLRKRGVSAFPLGLLIVAALVREGVRGGRWRCVQPVLPWPAEAMPALFLSSLMSASLSMSFPTAQDKLQVPAVPSYSHFPSETSVADTFWVICLIKAQDICWFLVYVERWKENERSSKSITDGQICKICFSHC